jgi:hypothetical protein
VKVEDEMEEIGRMEMSKKGSEGQLQSTNGEERITEGRRMWCTAEENGGRK